MTFKVGASVRRNDSGDIGVVTGVDHWPTVRVAFGAETSRIHADELSSVVADPMDSLEAGAFGDPRLHLLSAKAKFLQHAYRFDPASSLSNSRIEPQPHQVFIAHRVVQKKLRPRMLLADEVGLGKTIEAGLIIKELIAREQASRILVIGPASLSVQWQTEMSSKFNEHFDIMDSDAAKHLSRSDPNPFKAVDKVICSLNFAAREKQGAQILEAGWDLVIFDEAHRVRRRLGQGAKTTRAYELADELKDHVEGLLLLTATPMQLDASELYSLVQLVEPGVFRSLQEFNNERDKTPALNELVRAIDQWDAVTDAEREKTFDRHQVLLSRVGVRSSLALKSEGGREQVNNSLAALHPLAEVMVRNRKAELGMEGRRIAKLRGFPQSDVERAIYEDVTEYLRTGYQAASETKNLALGFLMSSYQRMATSSSASLRASFVRRVASLKTRAPALKSAQVLEYLEDPLDDFESVDLIGRSAGIAMASEIAELESLIERLGNVVDTKTVELLKLLREIRGDETTLKVVIFTQFVETQLFLQKTLEHNRLTVAIFNGRMNLERKEAAIRSFRDDCEILISTEAGGEGRNLQFAHHLINYDLPWNPMKVEQRIGRLDRIGQKHPVQIHNLYYEDTLESRLVEVLHSRIKLFEESIGALDPILGDLEKEIERLAFAPPSDFIRFASDLEGKVLQARLAERRFADFALDRSSMRRDEANKLLRAQPMARQSDIEGFCREQLDIVGGQLLMDEDASSVVLSPKAAHRLRLERATLRGTFHTEVALRRNDIDFFAFGHTLVERLLTQATEDAEQALGVVHRAEVAEPTLEVVWRILANIGQPVGRLIRHAVRSDLVVRSEPLNRLPSGSPSRSASLPSWLTEAAAASEAAFRDESAGFRLELLRELETTKERRLREAERLVAYKKNRLESRLDIERQWLLDNEPLAASTPKVARVLPARRGQVSKLEKQLGDLDEQHAVRVVAIEEREMSFSANVEWITLVMPS